MAPSPVDPRHFAISRSAFAILKGGVTPSRIPVTIFTALDGMALEPLWQVLVTALAQQSRLA